MTEVVLPHLVWQPSPNESSRRGVAVRKIVVHVTVGAYGGAVSWLCNPKAQASAHVVLKEDGSEATQLVAWSQKAWHAADANAFSEGLEMAGYPDKESDAQLKIAARIVAFRLHHHGLPARYAPEWGTGGFCRHGDLGVGGGNHLGCPMTQQHFVERFVPFVHHEAERGGFRPSWGKE